MAARRQSSVGLYGTKEVARILNIHEWRVKNFTEGGAYGLPPTVKVGSGRGSRRLYTEIDLVRFGMAAELVNNGFTPETVGRGIREIPESLLKRQPYGKEAKPGRLPVLFNYSGTWTVRPATEAARIAKGAVTPQATHGVFVLNIRGLCEEVYEAIDTYVAIDPFGEGAEE